MKVPPIVLIEETPGILRLLDFSPENYSEIPQAHWVDNGLVITAQTLEERQKLLKQKIKDVSTCMLIELGLAEDL